MVKILRFFLPKNIFLILMSVMIEMIASLSAQIYWIVLG